MKTEDEIRAELAALTEKFCSDETTGLGVIHELRARIDTLEWVLGEGRHGA